MSRGGQKWGLCQRKCSCVGESDEHKRRSAGLMTPVSVGEYHGLRVGSALLGIVAGCIIIGVSRECDADAVGGIFLGAGGLGEYALIDSC